MKEKLITLIMVGLSIPLAAYAAKDSVESSAEKSELSPVYISRCIDASIEGVWDSWTTAAGIRTFFARDGVVEPHVDGEYSVLFFPENPPGLRGAEGMRIVALEPSKRLVITWNQPPQFATIKDQRALVEYRFRERSDCGTEVQVKHFGWGQGDEWAQAREYFQGAWETILDRLEYQYEHGPLDWDNVPDHLWYRGPSAASSSDIQD
jgi:uncharacterized protein YndB with AHSA1/START domain